MKKNIVSADKVAENYSGLKVGINLGLIDGDGDGDDPLLLIEGSPIALRMIAELIMAVADSGQNTDFSISPNGAGSVHFAKKSKYGIYINCQKE